MKIITDEHCAGYSHDGHPERPERITRTLAYLQGQTELPIDWAAPGKVDDVQILRAHSAEHLARLNKPEDFDADTPFYENIAIAVLEAAAMGAKRAAVFDFDAHHGNGTEAILLDRPGIAFFSVHLYPFYPGTGAANAGKNCFNYPVAPNAPPDLYRGALARALDDLKKFQPDLALGVPLFSLLEGGYSRDLPELIFAYLKGIEGK